MFNQLIKSVPYVASINHAVCKDIKSNTRKSISVGCHLDDDSQTMTMFLLTKITPVLIFNKTYNARKLFLINI